MADGVDIIDWNAVLRSKEFWKSYYLWEEYSDQVLDLWLKQLGLFKPYDPECEDPDTEGLPDELLLTVPLRGGYGLEWSFYPYEGASSHYLYLLHPELGKVEIGYTGGHFHMDTFRWSERQAIVDTARECWDAGFEFKFFPPLLGAYLGTTPADATEANAAQLGAEWEAVGVLNGEDVTSLVAAILDRGDDDRRWEFDSIKGWAFSGDGYSTRDKQFGEMAVFHAMDDFLKSLNALP